MAKRKTKLSKQRQRQIKQVGFVLLLLIVGGLAGWILKTVSLGQTTSRNLVWGIDETVQVPSDLKTFLQAQDRCHTYRGVGTPTGVGLWAVQQISKDRFAKVVHGCSWSLEGYVMVIKDDQGWRLLEPKEYFADSTSNSGQGALPTCAVLEKHQIDKTIEPFCIRSNNKAVTNPIE